MHNTGLSRNQNELEIGVNGNGQADKPKVGTRMTKDALARFHFNCLLKKMNSIRHVSRRTFCASTIHYKTLNEVQKVCRCACNYSSALKELGMLHVNISIAMSNIDSQWCLKIPRGWNVALCHLSEENTLYWKPISDYLSFEIIICICFLIWSILES